MLETQHCLDLAGLERFLEEEGSNESVAIHIRGCEQCQSRLNEICQDSELASWIESRSKNLAEEFFAPGSMIDHYRLVRQIGRGGMSVVYQAMDTRLKRAVAIKLLQRRDQNESAVARFLREASAIANIRHSNVITVYHVDTGDSSGLPYLVMELVDGPCLQEFLIENKRIEPEQAAKWISQIADGMAAAHALGIVHRDVKPSNILLCPVPDVPSQYVAMLADFGLAQTDSFEVQLTRTGVLTGTPAYVSPEQLIDNSTSPRSDIYSLGVTLFQILTGELPFRGSPHAVLKQIAEDEIPSLRKLNSAIPLPLETICLKATNPSADHRYQTASDFAADLRRWLRGDPILATPVTRLQRGIRWVRRNRRIASLLTMVSSLLVLIAVGSVWTAIAIAKSKRELAKQVLAAQSAANESQLAFAQADQQFRIAEEQKSIAIEQRSLAIGSVDTLLDEVQQKLDFNPGALRLREKLIRTALAGLTKIAKSGEDEAVQQSRMSALMQLATVQSLIGKSEESREVVKEATAIAEAIYQKDHESPHAIITMGFAKGMQAEASLATFGSETRSLFGEAERFLKLGLEKQPDNVRNQRQWIYYRGKIGDVEFNAGRYAEARSWFEPALRDIAELSNRFPDRESLRRDHCVMLRRQAQCLSVLKEPGARGLLNQAVELAETGQKTDPDNTIHRSDLAYLLGALANLDSNERNFEDGISNATRSVHLFEALVLSDPSNTQTQVHVSATYSYLATIYLAKGDLTNAIKANEVACQSSLKLIDRNPKTSRFRLMLFDSMFRIAEIQVRQKSFGEATEQMRKAIQVALEARTLPDAPSNVIDNAVLACNVRSDLVRICGLGEQVAETMAHPLLIDATRSYVKALCGETDTAWELAIRVRDKFQESHPPIEIDVQQKAFCLINAARGASLSYQSLTKNKNQDETKHSPEEHMQLAIELLKQAVQETPALSLNIHMEPDLSFVPM